ncbi:MAG: acyl-CoA thioesterase [Acidobacteriota bacterium]|nr:acyl-CoA thioesterase [Acidobacteriota bacterium]
MTEHETSIRVRYAETDQMGVAYHANYLVWMEVARVDFCTALGFRYRDMEREDGVFLVVVEANCRYLRPARFDDEVRVRASILEAGAKIVRFGYQMHRAEGGDLLATGFTKHLCVGRDMGVVRLPEKYRALFCNTVKV